MYTFAIFRDVLLAQIWNRLYLLCRTIPVVRGRQLSIIPFSISSIYPAALLLSEDEGKHSIYDTLRFAVIIFFPDFINKFLNIFHTSD